MAEDRQPFGDIETDELDLSLADVEMVSEPPAVPGGVNGSPEGDVALAADARELIEACDRELTRDPDRDRAARLHYEIARLYEGPLSDSRHAADHYLKAADLAPDHAPSLRGARRSLLAAGDHQKALGMYDAEVRITSEPAARARLLYQKGRLLEDELGMGDRARATYLSALELDPGSLSILEAVERCDRHREAWGELVGTYEKLATAVDDPALRAALTAERARLVEERLDDPSGATQLYQAAVETASDSPGALASLVRLARGQRLWRELARAFEWEHELLADPGEKAMALYRLARVRDRGLGDVPGAIEALERAVAAAPADIAMRRDLATLYERAGRHAELAAALSELLDGTEAEDDKAAVALRLAQLYETRLDDDTQARVWYEIALRHQPGQPEAAESLAALYERTADFGALAELLGAQAEATHDADARAELHVRLGALYEDRLDRVDDAEQQYAVALGLAPDHELAFRALDRLYAQRSKWRELVEQWERRVDRAPEDDRAVVWLFRIGSLYEDRLFDQKGAVHTYRRILDRQPGHLGALAALQRAARRGQLWDELVRALDAETEAAPKERAVALALEAARVLAAHLEDDGGAIARLREALEKDPRSLAILRELGGIYQRLGRWDDLRENAERIVALVPREQQIDTLYRLGELCSRRIGDDEAAAGYFRRALEIEPAHEPSYRALSAALEGRQDWKALAALWEERVGTLSDPVEDAHLALDLGELYEERLGAPDRALAAYERALASVPGFRPAADARVRLLTDSSAWQKLAEAFREEVEQTSDPSVRLDALVRQGEVLAHRVHDIKGATAVFEEVVAQRPGDVRSLLALEELYRRAKDRDGLVRTIERQTHAFGSTRAKVAALRELARIHGEQGDEASARAAESAWKRLLELAPDDPEALETLAAAAAARGDRSESVKLESRMAAAWARTPSVAAFHQARVAEMLEATGLPEALAAYRAALALDGDSLSAARGFARVARRSGDPGALREAAENEAKITRDEERAVDLLLRAAGVRRQRNDLQGAAEDLARALELAPGHADAAAELERVMVLAHRVDELVELLGRAARSASPAERAASLHVQIARLHAERRNDLPAAVASVERALEVAPRHLSALSDLAGYHERAGHHKQAVGALMNLALRSSEPRHLVDAHLRLARLAEEKLNDLGRARKSLEQVLETDADNRDALARLARIHGREGRHDEALDLARKLADRAETDQQRAQALVEVGRIERLRGQPPDAAAAFLEAMEVQGPGGEAAVQYRQLITDAPDHAGWKAYVAVLQKHVERSDVDDAGRAATWKEVARTLADELGQREQAITVLRDATRKRPADVDLAVALARRLRQKGAHGDAIGELERALGVDVRSPAAWREMSEALRAAGEPAESTLALVPLRVFDAATPEELVTLRGLPVRSAQARPGLLGDAGFREIQIDGAASSVAAELMSAVSEGLLKLYPADIGRYGVGRRDRIGARSEHPLRTVADRVAEILGVTDFDVYLHDSPGQEVRVELGSTPALMMPSWARQLSHAQLVFLLAVPLAHVARGTHPLLRVPEREVPAALAAAARVAAPGFGSGIASEQDLDNQARLIQKGVPRRDRKAHEEAAARYAAAPPPDVLGWARAMHGTCARAALLVCDDLTAALDVLARTGGETVGPPNTATDLVRFWMSDPARRFRRASPT